MDFLFLILSVVLGYASGGQAIAALHRYAHSVKVKTCHESGPISAAIYVLYHTDHHRHTRIYGEPQVTTWSWKVLKQELKWAVPFALFNQRWVALRLVFCYRAFLFMTLSLGGCLVGLEFIYVPFGVVAFLMAEFGCLVAYDLCHMWTHSSGPLPSSLHVAHHHQPSGNFGMWRWHNWFGVKSMNWTLRGLRHVEKVISRLPRLRQKHLNMLTAAQRETGY